MHSYVQAWAILSKLSLIAVSYTHLDVYKRQVVSKAVSIAKVANFACSKFGMSLINKYIQDRA